MTITKLIKKHYIPLTFGVIIFLGVLFRIYNLSWGSPYFFHPDERNIASSISQLKFPDQMNPHFFAYGSLPIYSIYFTGVILNIATNAIFHLHKDISIVQFENAILIGRAFSVILSILSLYLIYNICLLFTDKKVGLISVMLACLSVGFIQYAHFATFETWLTFFTLLLVYSVLNYIQKKSIQYFLHISFLLGILLSIKVSTLVYLPLCIIILLLVEFYSLHKSDRKKILIIERIILKLFLLIGITVTIIALTSPFFWIDNADFLSSMHYETSVALGTLPVFYSQGFEKSIPLLYQFVGVYPFIVNPLITILFLFCFPYFFIQSIKEKNKSMIVLVLFFLITFLSQSFLYVKWIRYYIPTIAFFYIFIGFSIRRLFLLKRKKLKYLPFFGVFLILIISLVYAFSYFKTVLINPDTRVSAFKWSEDNIPKNSHILSEVYDLGIIPFNAYFKNIRLFNFYDLDSDKSKLPELNNLLSQTDYIILPSQRILKDRIQDPSLFPLGNLFYKKLLNGNGYKKVYQTPCNLFCKILYLKSPIFSFEETANVFDRPQVMIFEKVK